MADPVTVAKAAQAAWRARKPLAYIAGVAAVLLTMPLFFAIAVVTTVTAADTYCGAENIASQTASDVVVEARKRGAGLPATNVLSAFSATATATYPIQSVGFAGLYRLPPEYAAGVANSKGRWNGPQDTITGDPARDSRNFTPAATRAVMRALNKTDALTWRELNTMDTPPSGQALKDFTTRASTMFTTTFPGVPFTQDALTLALTQTLPTGDSYGYGDAVTGGVLITGDPVRAAALAKLVGPKAFGGGVTVTGSSADPTLALEGLYREISAQDGLVIIVSDTPPTLAVIEDAQDATLATVMWITRVGTPNEALGVYVDDTPLFTATMSRLESIEGASAPGLLCDGVVAGGASNSVTLDPALIIAPDPAAQIAIAAAREQLGEPYVAAGGARPPVSWDCSKLTTYAWEQAGIKLVPYSYTQWDQVQRIPESAVAPGDLIFWFRAGAHHVAIVDEVTASGQIFFVGAANPESGVTRDELSPGWYRDKLTGFGRVKRDTTT